MTNNGKAQVSAPQCALTTTSMNQVATDVLTTSSGDSVVGTAYTASTTAASADLNVSQQAGFIGTLTLIVAPGTDKEEEATMSGAAGVEGAGNLTLTSTNSSGQVSLEHDHPSGTRVVVKRPAIRPGSVVVRFHNETREEGDALDPTGTGVIPVGTDIGGSTATAGSKIDYALGSVTLNTAAIPATAGQAAKFDADTLADTPADIASGKNFFKNFARMSNGRADLPTGAVISNLGSAEVGVFVESTQSASSSAFTNNQNSANAVIKGFGSKVVTFEGGLPAEMRIRAGTDSQASMSPSTATERNNDPGVIDVAFFSVTNANGGSN